MLTRCCISSCKMNVRVAEAKGLSYHCFPLKDPHREKWIQAILPHVDKPESFKIVQGYTRVCSRHFRIKEYSLDSKKRARLNSNAVPSVFPRKNTPVFVQAPIEAAKSQVAMIQSAAKAANTNCSALTPTDDVEVTGQSGRVKEETNLNPTFAESICSNDQKILDLLNAVSVDNLDGLGRSTAADDIPSDGSNDDKQDQTKRKRRKWNRTAFARSSKTKQKKPSNSLNSCLTDNTFDEDALDDLNLCSLLGLTRNNSLDLDPDLEIHSGVASLGLNGVPTENGLQQSTSSSSSISLCDPIKFEDLNLMSVEEQELLQSIQAVSLDCGEADMNLNMKNIHIGPADLGEEEPITTHLLDGSTQKSLLRNPILLEDALISSASEMSLQSPADQKAGTKQVIKRVRAPSASEIEKLACDFRSSLLTSVNLPATINLAFDEDDLRLPETEFTGRNSIGLGLGDSLSVSEKRIVGGETPRKRDQSSTSRQSTKSVNKKGPVPKKKLVGITKKPKNSDKYFGKFSVERFSDSNKDIEYYTGFPTFSHFEAFFNSLESHVEKLKVTDIMHGVADLIRTQQQEAHCSHGNIAAKEETGGRENTEDQKRRPITGRSMSRIDELFMTLIRLKRRLPEKVLGHMFYVSQPTVSRTIRAWTMLLSKLLEPIPSSPETAVTESLKPRQPSSKSNGESNYFTNKGIYIPDSFRQLFLTDVATSIITSAHNPRLNSTSNSLLVSSVETVNNNNKELNIANRLSAPVNSRSDSSPNASCNCDYRRSCDSATCHDDNDERIAFTDSNILGPCSEVEIDSSDYYQWGLLVKE
ncbi:unnamed protein product [Allacma fusca]|uniref:THAP-type domain-containing protein n=1 Tax=Allacma fusca TaxID=39272 RepID=A0A8J2L0S0_9HEXA|nr:unnamed protein product [Allacma fusca]